jgi:chromosome segregation ATPase
MADLKATSFRLNEEDLEKFKQFMDNEGIKTQAEGFKAIMQSVEMAKAKGMIKDRAKEIEVFQDTINNLMSYFLNSLNVNQTSEERIREELQKELSTKDNTISALYEQVQELKADNETFKGNEKIKETIIKQASEEVKKLQKDIEDKQSQLDIANRNNNNLQDQVAEYKQYKDNYKTIEKELEQLKAEHEALKDTNNKLTNDNVLLNDKVKNNSDMIEFYKSNNVELKDNIKALEIEHKQAIQEVKTEAIRVLDERIKAKKQELINKEIELNNKYDIEVGKKDLEIQKLKNDIEQLKVKE